MICLEDNFEELEHIISELFKIYFEKVQIGKNKKTKVKHSFLQDLAINVPRLAEDLAKLLVMIYKDALKVISRFI